jgi:molybdenum cofactor cytidylyltransferase
MRFEAVILAAGLSSRAKTFKMELKIGEKSLLERCILAFIEHCDRVIVVGGYQYEKIKRITDKFKNVELVINYNYEEGMFSSVKEGIKTIKAERFFLTPGDYPFISKDVIAKLMEEKSKITIPTFNGKKGHPIIIDSSLIPEILKEKNSYNLRDFTIKQGYEIVEVEDDGIIYDVDTMDDYKKIKDKYKK